MTTKRDIDILIECHDEALAKRNAIAVDIADIAEREEKEIREDEANP